GMIPLAPLSGFTAPVRKPVQSGEIDATLQAKVAAREIPGIVAMAANETSVVYERAFGLRNMATTTSMSPDTIFRIASMVKLLTSVAAMQLVERGRLKLDEPAGNVDPMLPAPRTLTGCENRGAPQLREARESLTLRNLLTHTSGFSYPLWDTKVLRYVQFRRAKKDKDSPRVPL